MKSLVILATASLSLLVSLAALAQKPKIVFSCRGSMGGEIRIASWDCPNVFEENEYTVKNATYKSETDVFISNSYHLDQVVEKGVGRASKLTCLYSRLDHSTNRTIEGTCVRVE